MSVYVIKAILVIFGIYNANHGGKIQEIDLFGFGVCPSFLSNHISVLFALVKFIA